MTHAEKRQTRAQKRINVTLDAFEEAARELELASTELREVHDDYEQQINKLAAKQHEAKVAGENASRTAKRIREFFFPES